MCIRDSVAASPPRFVSSRHVRRARDLGAYVPATQGVCRRHRVQDLPQAGLAIAAGHVEGVVKAPHRTADAVSYLLLDVDALPERHMLDTVGAVTEYQRRCGGRVLAESFVVMAEGIGFGKGTSGVDIEQ